jgi:hypothetical protein
VKSSNLIKISNVTHCGCLELVRAGGECAADC